MSRSLRVDPKYIQKVNLALKRNGYPSQRKFAEDIVPSLSTVKNFLKGKPVDYENFREICERLGLDWQAITYIDVDVEPDQEVAKPPQESVESDAGSIEERIFKATNQLNPERPVFSRISGIQALGEIAKDSPRYHWQIMEVLAAFVRTNAPRKEEGEEERSPKISDDIQAALTVIGRSDPEKDPPKKTDSSKKRLNLSNIDIRGAILNEANLHRVILTKANLQDVNFDRAYLQEAILKETNLKKASFYNTKLQETDLRKANLQEVCFLGADLQGAFLSATNMQGVNLQGATLKGASLSIANLEGASLHGADLSRANLQGANFMGANLLEVDLAESNLQGTKLRGADLTNAKNLKLQQIELAYVDSTTTLPDYLERLTD
jgi:uncharacterized protein YjbI with pentapeptide repeats